MIIKNLRILVRLKKKDVTNIRVACYLARKREERNGLEACGSKESSAAEDWCREWDDGRERLYRVFAVKSALPFHASFSFSPLGKPAASPWKLSPDEDASLYAARASSPRKKGPRGVSEMHAFAHRASVPRLVRERIAKLATLCESRKKIYMQLEI